MPRLKRIKVAPPESLVRTVQHARPSSILSQRDPSSSVSSSGAGTKGSDDSEGLVTTKTTGTDRKGVPRQEATMSGALEPEDTGKKPLKPLRGRKRALISRIAREGDHARAIEVLKAQRDAALAKEAGLDAPTPRVQPLQPLVVAKPTGLVNDAPRPTTGDTQIGLGFSGKPAPIHEASVLIAAQPKRRPRQPSLLQVAQSQNAAPASDDEGSLADFEPNDTSTPFQKRVSQQKPASSSPSLQQNSSSRKRKLSTTEIPMPASQSPI
ncbi:MAG: hypothetical protein Q9190_003207, partial [Brigantiaea leucoxantha]